MLKGKQLIWIILVLLGLVAVLAIWFWSLGSPVGYAPPKLQLAIEKGSVLISKDGNQIEEKAASGQELKAGDRLRTTEGSVASIMVYGRADVRLAENTVLVVSEASGGEGDSYVLRWKVESGRVWSRVLRLLDMDSEFQGQSSQVVATVRGTAFALTGDASGSRLLVDHGGVLAKDRKDGKPSLAVTGQWLDFDSQGGIKDRGDVASSTWKNDGWVGYNQESDQRFSQAAADGMADSLGAKGGAQPDDRLYGLAVWSERLHLGLAGKNKVSLQAGYWGRHLGQVQGLVKRGKSGLAFQLLSQLENEMQKALEGKEADAYRTALRPIVGRALLALSQTGPESSAYRLKIRVEDLHARLWENDPVRAYYARALSVDARLDEAELYDCTTKDTDKVKEAVNAVEQGLAREQADWEKINGQVPDKYKSLLEEKFDVQKMRLEVLKKRLENCSRPVPETMVPPLDSASSTQALPDSQATTTTTTVPITPPTKPPTTPTTNPPSIPTVPPVDTTTLNKLGLTRIELFANPNPANVGDSVTLYVKGYKADGSTLDVTRYATFQVNGDLGTLSGAKYQTSKAGSVTLVATVVDSSQTFTARASLMINQTVALSRLDIRPAGGTLYSGQSTNLTATAVYSNGFTKLVTGDAKWSLSNALASMGGSTITAGKQPGTVTVTASYTDTGVTKTQSVDFTISMSTQIP
jgi:hypothetical protein